MIDVQANSFEKQHPWDKEFTREGFVKNWKKTLKKLQADPAAVEDIGKSIVNAYKSYDLPEVPILIRKESENEKGMGENAHWDNGFMVILDHAVDERKYRSQVRPLDSSPMTVKEAYPDVLSGLVVHELGHKYHDDHSGLVENARLLLADSETKKRISKSISGYAATHPKELVAEAYAMRKHLDFDRLPDETKSLVNSILSGKSSAAVAESLYPAGVTVVHYPAAGRSAGVELREGEQ